MTLPAAAHPLLKSGRLRLKPDIPPTRPFPNSTVIEPGFDRTTIGTTHFQRHTRLDMDAPAVLLLTVTSNGNMYLYPNTGGTGTSTFGSPTLIGTGWGAMRGGF